jgi:hypothetical protein
MNENLRDNNPSGLHIFCRFSNWFLIQHKWRVGNSIAIPCPKASILDLMFRIYRGEWVTAKLANGSNTPKNTSIKNCILNKKCNLMRQTQIHSAPDQHGGFSLSQVPT